MFLKTQTYQFRGENIQLAKSVQCSHYKSTAAISSLQSALCPVHIFWKKSGDTKASFAVTSHVMNVSKGTSHTT